MNEEEGLPSLAFASALFLFTTTLSLRVCHDGAKWSRGRRGNPEFFSGIVYIDKLIIVADSGLLRRDQKTHQRC